MKFSAWFDSLKRAARWHRRGLGALAAAACLVCVLASLSPAPPPARSVLITTDALVAGTTLATEHLKSVDVPLGLVPDGALTDSQAAIGRVLAAGRSRGAILTASDLVGQGLVAGEPGLDLVSFRVADPAVVELLSVGDRITVIGSSPEGAVKPLADHVRIAALHEQIGEAGFGGTTSQGALIIVAAPPQTAQELAAAATQYTLGVVLDGS